MSMSEDTRTDLDDEVLLEAEAASILGMSGEALRQRRVRATRSGSPKPCPRWRRTRGGDVRYLRSDVEAWKAQREAEANELEPDPMSPHDAGDSAR